jgi:hypothetical protein
MTNKQSVWATLSAIDCSDHVEQKGKLTYLSWAWAWQKLMENYPGSTYEYAEPSYLENGTVEVSVSVRVQSVTHSMWLPVMDNRNKSIVNPTTRDISDARMRCLVKAIAMHGLGIYIYAGEDLPESTKTDLKEDTTTGSVMPKYAKEFRVEANSIDDAEMRVYDEDLEPMEVKPLGHELVNNEEELLDSYVTSYVFPPEAEKEKYSVVGTLRDRYEIYVSCMEGSGEYTKTFDEWVNS